MISASHNPYSDNGIKFFSAAGYKLDDQIEEAIEAEFQAASSQERVTGAGVGKVWNETYAWQDYIDFLAATFAHAYPIDLRIGLDCAHGAASEVAPRLFRQLGARVAVWHAEPDGCNINVQCGSLHPEMLQQRVVEEGLDLGFAFDGDADRVIAVDHTGRCLDGDYILTVAAQALQRQGHLAQNAVVSTVMANMGLDKVLRTMGVRLYKTQVGDKYVMQEMQRRGAVLGGEQSGHILFLQHHTTGDGLLAALQLVQAVVGQQTPLAELARVLHKFPQQLVNVGLRERRDPLTIPQVQDAIRDAEAILDQEGRIVVRLSGTEPVARVMVEGPSHALIDPLAHQIAHAITAELGPASE
jgi:phosphoglucosamine mutase